MLRLRTIGSALAITLLFASAALGQGKLEITPMVGISTAGSVDLNTEVSNRESFSVGSGFTWGGTLGYYLSRYIQFEVEYARQNSNLSPDFDLDPDLPRRSAWASTRSSATSSSRPTWQEGRSRPSSWSGRAPRSSRRTTGTCRETSSSTAQPGSNGESARASRSS